jgi:hypothetical protein
VIPIQPVRGWKKGRFTIVASSRAAKGEWDDFVSKAPKAMKRAYERLSKSPLEVHGTRQFPLKGKRNKPFWEYEITAGDRLYYAVDLAHRVVVVAVLPHATAASSMIATVHDRRGTFDNIVADQEAQSATTPSAQPPTRKRKKR